MFTSLLRGWVKIDGGNMPMASSHVLLPLESPKATPKPSNHQKMAPRAASPMFLMRMFFVFLTDTEPT